MMLPRPSLPGRRHRPGYARMHGPVFRGSPAWTIPVGAEQPEGE
ncbi:hypothetical protein GbCGDNIH2_2213 [Granulibacter bethesdensis]|uniref:Uncharacterized protein n=2 Tax=Granulibacter bethesdensis TaxID=364410 RepID=Q0BPZ1_GRABC|nr:hypothetical protein GbCGDNIH1_2213 [Granulibacter bethesdensis CGDNIH1]AHJ64114.1 hypothetical protein GbCGDNIH3_2213 [Granulibacter bethesdensis]AHJ65298.1 hypothetical protein GbCGDNIH4_2213 [Granulibacter bethesdensis CGDNIH4]AHJ67919.1 hypothetical protein GbCGDNIH2_2213 [Granulibacter bethesdensis]APH52986.1 hypothetical protein GbCGDNIH5_2213 [Granulibacter bethesdensis]